MGLDSLFKKGVQKIEHKQVDHNTSLSDMAVGGSEREFAETLERMLRDPNTHSASLEQVEAAMDATRHQSIRDLCFVARDRIRAKLDIHDQDVWSRIGLANEHASWVEGHNRHGSRFVRHHQMVLSAIQRAIESRKAKDMQYAKRGQWQLDYALAYSDTDESHLSSAEQYALRQIYMPADPLRALANQYKSYDSRVAYHLQIMGENGLRALSLAYERPEVARDAFWMVKTLSGPHLDRLFESYASLMDAAKDANAYSRETFGRELSVLEEARCQRFLREKAAGLLVQAVKQMPVENNEQLWHWPERIHKVMDDIMALAESESAKARLFASIFKLLKSGGQDIPLDVIRNSSFEVLRGSEILTADADAMVRIQGEQYRSKYPESELRELRDNLQRALKSPFATFYLFKKDEEIVSYVRFDELATSGNDEGTHAGSFMINPKFESGAIGQALFRAALERQLAKGDVFAECDPSLVPFYEKFGFRLLRSPYQDAHGVDTCDIVCESPDVLREAA